MTDLMDEVDKFAASVRLLTASEALLAPAAIVEALGNNE